jgi:hypothetical protein
MPEKPTSERTPEKQFEMKVELPTKEPAQPFTLEGGLLPLNDYFTLAPKDKKGVMAALWLATKRLPTAGEYSFAEKTDGYDLILENKYGNLADAYARSIDPNFSPKKIDNNSVTLEKRGKFYKMVRALTAEQVDIGVRKILKIEEEQSSDWGSIGIHGISSD